MNQQPVKRRNPFDKPKENHESNEILTQNEEILAQENAQEQQFTSVPYEESAFYAQQQVYQPQQQQYYEPKPVVTPQQTTQRVVKSNIRQRYVAVEEVVRDKFTSTMDRTLRRNIKIVCAQRGIMFAQFVEEACREKLAKEGIK